MSSEKKSSQPESRETIDVAVQKSTDKKRAVSRNFPGPAGQQIALRIAMEREAFANVIAHAKQSLHAEICGILAGEVCEDNEGLFVHVKAVVQGSAAREGGTHVTFTQETWNIIHKEMETSYPKLQIVGWYHSHPGFGVEFSEMDLFIQRNFFPADTQFALVTDPLGGDTAICLNTAEGIRYVDRFWVDGREHQCRVPGVNATEAGAGTETRSLEPLLQQLKEMETRIGQVIQSADEQRTLFNRVLMAVFFFACMGIAGVVFYIVYTGYTSRLEPPTPVGYVPLPVQIGDKTALLGVEIVKWDVPPELDAMFQKLVQARLKAEQAAAKEAQKNNEKKSGSATPSPQEQKENLPNGK